MNATEFEKKMVDHRKQFRELFDKMNIDVVKFVEENTVKTMYDLNTTDNTIDEIIQSAAWVKDKINDSLSTEKPKKSLVTKLRKALGYTYP